MPTTYAHYTFGQEVLKLLNGDIKKSINNNLDLFNIGLHGPDILFYFNPLKNNEVSQLGHTLHSMEGKVFFENARQVINSSLDYDAACAYIAGFICHFMLDTQCHPYIREWESDRLSHGTIETEFDRLIMLKNSHNPISFKPTSHIKPSLENAEVISWFFEGISNEIVMKALKSMKFYLNLLVAPGHLKRSIIVAGLKLSGNYDGMRGLIMNYEPVAECTAINERLYQLYIEGINLTVNIINEYFANIKSEQHLNDRFNVCFG
jgi:hypothetical protein